MSAKKSDEDVKPEGEEKPKGGDKEEDENNEGKAPGEDKPVNLEKFTKKFGDVRSEILKISEEYPDNEGIKGAASKVSAAYTAFKIAIRMTG